jgi:Na+-translocating ferredoxin:NAD+ oxidoreductase RnfG subunit
MEIPKNLVKIVVTVLAALITGLVGLVFYDIKKQMEFRDAWELDEATEEAVMFDKPEQKTETLRHIDRIKTDEIGKTLYKQRIIDSLILEKLDEIDQHNKVQDSLNIRLNDQVYQLNQKIDNR